VEEIRYIRKNWMLKKAKIIRYYIKLYINLGVYSTSRTENLHLVLKEELSSFTSLPLTIKRMTRLREGEANNRRDFRQVARSRTRPFAASFVWRDAPADEGQENDLPTADSQTNMRSVFQSNPSPFSGTVQVEEVTMGCLWGRYNT
jgi:hypothetical protein